MPQTATPRRIGRSWSVRVRVISLVLVTLTLGLVVAGVVTFAVQFSQLNDRIEAELEQEVNEIRGIAERGPGGSEEDTPYQDLYDLFEAYLTVSVPGDYESMLTLVDGTTAFIPGATPPFDLNVPEVKDEVERIFQRFGRSENHRSVDGSGLGLPIVVSIAQGHRGTVTLDSTPGLGSTFRVWIPAEM